MGVGPVDVTTGASSKLTHQYVWLSLMHIETDLMFGFTCEKSEESILSLVEASRRGVLLEPQDVPQRLWIKKERASLDRRKLPPLFSAGGFLTVSETFAEILNRHDLGRTKLHPIELLRSDERTAFEGRYFFLNIAEVHRYFSLEHSSGIKPVTNPRSSYKATTGFLTEDDCVKVVPAALAGPDLWLDDTLRTGFFCSDQLARALRAARLTRRLALKRCVVLAVN